MAEQAVAVDELCDIRRTCSVTGQSKSYIYRHMGDADNPFPFPKRIGRKSFWRMSDLQEWIALQWKESPRAGRWVGHHPLESKKPQN